MTAALPPEPLRFSIAIMAKAPVAGYAKTRLIPLLGAAGAARAQRDFIVRTLATALAAAPQSITLWCAPDSEQRFFRALRRWQQRQQPGAAPAIPLVWRRQRDGDLGARMAAVFAAMPDRIAHEQSTSAAAEPLLLIGTDCPLLACAHLRHAARALVADGADAVFAPVEDGGYVLVGLRTPKQHGDFGIFDDRIEWSTSRVMAQTRARLRTAGARWHELAPLWDVDEPADWLRWRALPDAQSQPDDACC